MRRIRNTQGGRDEQEEGVERRLKIFKVRWKG